MPNKKREKWNGLLTLYINVQNVDVETTLRDY